MPKKKPPAVEAVQDDSPRSPEQFRLALRRKTRLFYDIQLLRMQTQGRLTRKAPTAQIDLHPRDLVKLKGRLEDLQNAEKNALADLTEHLEEVPFYRDVIAKDRVKYKGLGPRMASVIISSFDIRREETASQMWSFAGLAPRPATRCKHCSVVVTEADGGASFKHPKPQGNKCRFAGQGILGEETFASGRAMKPTAGEKLPYNAWLRSKLCGVLGPVLLQLGSPYRRFYDDYKQRKVSAGWGTSDAHRHAASIRYMIKMLLLDIHKDWRSHEGLPVRPSYAEEKLGHVTTQAPIGSAPQHPPPKGEVERLDDLLVAELVEEGDAAE